ncbi:hypothetical protein EDB81DRAFT_881538 [Dactylonectria macrodidyma]|uniref:Uncharacterized protein n=1 Tax=Dactylonectria macrodidyma TaxID=307937 RepID=A0A9P9F491_9HYPO|nr:hypothetical protein EDB81DRAFT_881538 [Dactylonectria macrodidyma]
MEAALLQEILISAQYRLMAIDFEEPGLDDALRLVLLAFLKMVFLQTAGIKVRFAALSTQRRSQLVRVDWSTEVSNPSHATKLWLPLCVFMRIINYMDHVRVDLPWIDKECIPQKQCRQKEITLHAMEYGSRLRSKRAVGLLSSLSRLHAFKVLQRLETITCDYW